MIGDIAQGKKSAAAQLWAHYCSVAFSSAPPDLLFRFLAAKSVENAP
jgi:hypothetical protein